MKTQKTTKTFLKKFLITSTLVTGFLFFGQTKSVAQVYAQMNYIWDGCRSIPAGQLGGTYDVWTVNVSFYSDEYATGTPLYTLTSGFPVIQRDWIDWSMWAPGFTADSTPYSSIDFTSVFAYFFHDGYTANGQWWELDPSATSDYSIAADPVNAYHGNGIDFPWYGL